MIETLKIKTLDDDEQYKRIVSSYDTTYGGYDMVYPDFYKRSNYIYSFTDGLNLKPEYSTIVHTGVNKSDAIINTNDSGYELLAYKLNKPYYSFTLQYPIAKLNKGNVIHMLLKYLVQFQQLNYLYTPYYMSSVYDDVVIRIDNTTHLLPNKSKIKDGMITGSIDEFENSICDKNFTTVKEVVTGLGLLRARKWFVYSGSNFDGRDLLNKAKGNYDKSINDAKICDCIDSMMEASMFVCNDTIKEQIYQTGLRQIKRVVASKRQEINNYNINVFGVKTFAKYNDLQKVPSVLYI